MLERSTFGSVWAWCQGYQGWLWHDHSWLQDLLQGNIKQACGGKADHYGQIVQGHLKLRLCLSQAARWGTGQCGPSIVKHLKNANCRVSRKTHMLDSESFGESFQGRGNQWAYMYKDRHAYLAMTSGYMRLCLTSYALTFVAPSNYPEHTRRNPSCLVAPS